MFYGLSAQELQHIVRKPKPKDQESQETQESQKHEVSAIANMNYQSEKTIHQQ